MKFAFVEGQLREAQPTLSGGCVSCAAPMIAKCGERRAWHWAHKGRRHCDPWWENESEWHRAWKDNFPVEWQEKVHTAANGERHIADVKTEQGWVLEFQRSHIEPEERRSREAFYKQMVWVVDGMKRKRDLAGLSKAWDQGRPTGSPQIRRIHSDECRLLQEWAGGPVPVFLDFGGAMLVWVLGKGSDGFAFVYPMPRTQFIDLHRSQGAVGFSTVAEEPPELIARYEAQLSARDQVQLQFRPRGYRRSFRL